jgi:TolB-like protein/tetratricopeptide (TPR) repeat protein
VDLLAEIGQWITENESLLSGLAALVVLAGVIFSPLGRGALHLLARRRESSTGINSSVEAETAANASGGVGVSVSADTTDPVLAVLAFDNLSSDSEMQFFSDGISEEVIQRLCRGTSLKVIARTTSFQLRGEQKANAAQRLNCTHVLDGSIRRAAGRVRISAHLIEAASNSTLWSERFERELEDVFVLQDEIAESIARVLDREFFATDARAVTPDLYDRYLQASPRSFAPDELKNCVAELVAVTDGAPQFAAAWGRLAYLRAWLHFYQPYNQLRQASVEQVNHEAGKALALDPGNVEAMIGRALVIPPFGHFKELFRQIETARRAAGTSYLRRYIGWVLRSVGLVNEALEEAEQAYRLDALDPMSANLVALARMAAGRISDAIPVYESLLEREPQMSFPLHGLLRALAIQGDWQAVDRLLDLTRERQLREFEDGLSFIRTKRNPTPENLSTWKTELSHQVISTGHVDVSRLVYTAHLGLVDLAYELVNVARLGPTGTAKDVLGPDAYRTSLLFQANLPELRNDVRFPRLCARLGLVEFWTATGKWPDCTSQVPYDFQAACNSVGHVDRETFWLIGKQKVYPNQEIVRPRER